jgi:hypothetical protein
MATPKNERSLITPVVKINGNTVADLHCLTIEDSVGMTPSRAMILQTYGQDVTGPNCLVPQGSQPYKYGMRVEVWYKDSLAADPTALVKPIFCGWLLRRSDQCSNDKTIWQALDDRVLMQWIAVRGALVWDDIDKKVRYSPRHLTSFNPNGFWNCTGYADADYTATGLVPIFTSNAKQVLAYETPVAEYDWKTLTAGDYNPWTPRRALQYLRYWAYYGNKSSDFPASLVKHTQTFLSGSATSPLNWTMTSINNMAGQTPDTSDTDPLDRKMQSLSVQGGSLLQGIQRILDVAGTHSLRTTAMTSADGAGYEGRSKVEFMMTGYNAAIGGGGNAIVVQRGGSAGNHIDGEVPDAYDFRFDEDASQLCESVLVEGDVTRAEASVDFYGPNANALIDYSADTDSDIIPAWERAQEAAFLKCIHGGDANATSDTYAMRAKVNGDPTSLELCNGANGTPVIWARSREAVEAAREGFPWVYRAWRLNSRSNFMQATLGYPEAVGNATEAEAIGGMKTLRPILGEQLQFMLRNLGGGTDVKNWMIQRLPIRVRLADPTIANDAWIEVPKDIGAKVDGEGIIWLDSLGESANNSRDCIFNGDLISEDDYKESRIYLRKAKMNLAFPADFRVKGLKVATPRTDIAYNIRNAFLSANGATPDWLGLSRYQDEGASYKWGYQSQSSPALSPKYFGGANGLEELAAPLERDVPPGPETIHAEYSAQRTLARFANPHRQASFAMIGVRVDWKAGRRVNYILFKSPAGGVTYNLNGCIMSATHDFLKQQTDLGGLLDEYGAG